MNSPFPSVCPEVPVRDLGASLAYYRDRLGFVVDWSDEALGLAGVSQGGSRLFLSNVAYRSTLGNGAPIVLWFNLNSRMEIDVLHRRWASAGAAIAEPPAAKPYKLYEFFAQDLDGNILRVFYDFSWEER